MFSHVMVGSSNLDRSRLFYDAVLGTLGVPAGFLAGAIALIGIVAIVLGVPTSEPWLMASGATIVSVVIGWLITRSVTGPVDEAVRVAETVASGAATGASTGPAAAGGGGKGMRVARDRPGMHGAATGELHFLALEAVAVRAHRPRREREQSAVATLLADEFFLVGRLPAAVDPRAVVEHT